MNKYIFRPKTKEFSPHPQQLKSELEDLGIPVIETSLRMVVIESTKEVADQILLNLGQNWLLFEVDPNILYTTPKPPTHSIV